MKRASNNDYADADQAFMDLMTFLLYNKTNATIRHEADGIKVRCTFKF